MNTKLFLILSALTPGFALAQTTTLQCDDNSMEQLWSLTSPNAGPGDWIGVGYTPPFEFPFRIVSATMYYLDSYCCSGSVCGDSYCVGGADWDRRVIAHQNLGVDSAGLTPDITNYVARELNIPVDSGSTALSPPWTMTPNVWTLPAGTVFDHPGRVFYAIKYFDGDEWMRFAVDNTSTNQGASVFTSDNFTTRSAIWSFGNVGMRIAVEPIFSLKLSGAQPAASFQLRGTTRVPMLVLRVAGGNASTSLTRVRVTATGSGNDATAVSAVRLIVDANRNGVEDTGELQLASGTYAVNNGTVDLNFARSLATGTDEQWLVVYDFNTVPAGGETFTARVAAASDVLSNLGSPFMSGTTGGTGAIIGNAVTIAGRLLVARGPASMASQIVAAGAADVAPLQIRLTAENETFSVTEVAVTADGSLNDLTSLSNVRLVRDADSSGTFNGGDVLLATGSYSVDNGRLVFPIAPLSIAANTSRDLIVVYNLSASAAGGETFRTILAASTDVTASGSSSGAIPATGARALSGAPVIGNLATVGGALTVSAGAANPANGTAQPGTVDVPVLQLSLAAQSESIGVTALTISSAGTGDEPAHVARVHLYRDVNGNGLRDGGDVAVGLPQTYAANDGIVTFAFAPEVIPANASRLYLVTYDFTATPIGGETFTARLASAANLTAEGQASGATITPSGTFPISGGTRTLLGGLSFTLGPENPPAANRQPGAADVPVLQIQIAAQGEQFDVSSLRVTAAGSVAEQTGVLQARLWRDLGVFGARDAADVLLGTATFATDDGTATFTISPARAIAAGTSDRWLLTYDLTSAPAPGQTFRASIALASDVTATGVLSGAASPSGLPLTGNTHAVGGTLALSAAPPNPLGGVITPGGTNIVMIAARLTAVLEPITITAITFTASGSGNELTGVNEARLYVDTNHDGAVDVVGDVQLGTPRTFTANDGAITFPVASRTIPAGSSEDWIVAYAIGSSPIAGETFQLQIANDTSVTGSAPSGVLPRTTGAPVSGGSKTMLGDLIFARGTNTPAGTTVRRDATNVPVLQLLVRGVEESFTISRLVAHALGSVDDPNDLTGVTLWDDVDASGTIGAADSLIAGPVAFSGDDGQVVFSGLSVAVASGGVRNLLLGANFAGTALGGTTLRLAVSTAAEVTASGYTGRAVTPSGLPISSETVRAGGTLEVSLGAASPFARVVQRGATGVEEMQIHFVASTETATLDAITLHASGLGHDALGIANVELVLDANANGRADATELVLGSGTFTADDGTATIPLAQSVPVGPGVYLVARLSFTQQPLGGDTFRLSVTPEADVAISSATNAVAVIGAPIAGAELTAGGGFEVAVGPSSGAGTFVNQSQQNIPVVQLDLRAINETCTVGALTFRAAGSIDDAQDITAVRIIHDLNDNGVFDFSDVQVGLPATYNLDDGTVSFSGLAQAIGANASQRWLVVYDLAGTASNLETFNLRLERDVDLVVACSVSGPVTPLGTPIESGIFTIQEDGALVVTRGSQSPPPLFIEAGSVRAPVLALRLAASVRDIDVASFALTAATTGVPSDTIAAVELFRDVNQDGLLDRSDPLVARGSGPDSMGRVNFAPMGLSVTTADPVYLLATADIARSAAPGATFTIAFAANSDLVAASGLGTPIVTGAPVASETMTVAGNLNLRATAPAQTVSVQNDMREVVALDFEIAATWESFTLHAITVTAEGSMTPATAIAGLTLAVDEGGTRRELASGVTFPQGAKRATIAGLAERIDAATTKHLLVLADLAGTARVRETMTLSIAANVDVVAAGDRAGLTSPVGAPIVGDTFGVGPSLSLAAGPASVPDSIVAANAEHVPAIQLRFDAHNEDVTITRLSLHASGSLDDTTGIQAVHLLLDANADGKVDPGDIEVASPARVTGDDGTISFAPLAEHLARNAGATYLVTVDLSGAGTAGNEVTLSIESDADVTAFGALSGAVNAELAARIAGARISLVGALNVMLGSASPAGSGVRPGTSFAALQLELATRGETVSVERIVFDLGGTADDARVIAGAKLWRDLDGDGAAGDDDQVAGSAAPAGDDGMLSFESLGIMIPADTSARVLVIVELAADAEPGGTIRVSLADNANVWATGASSGAITTVGAPLEGSSFTIVRAPAGGGGPGEVAEGCGCNATRRGPSTSAWIVTLLLLLWAPRLRRTSPDRPTAVRSALARGLRQPRAWQSRA